MSSNLLRLMSSSGVFLYSIDLWPRPPGPLLLCFSASFRSCEFAWSRFLSWVLLLLLCLQILSGLLKSLVVLLCLCGFFSVFICLWSYYILLDLFISVFLREWRQRTTAFLFLFQTCLCHLKIFEQYYILFSSINLVLVVCGSDGNERPLRFFVTYICHLTLFKAGLVCLNLFHLSCLDLLRD